MKLGSDLEFNEHFRDVFRCLRLGYLYWKAN